MSKRTVRRAVAVLFAVTLLASTLPGVAVADETRSGGVVVVEEGETVDGDLTATAGTVVVNGTVTGDVDAFAGDVQVAGTVEGDVSVFAGNVRVTGDVGGDLSVVGGNAVLDGGAVTGSLDAVAGNVVVDGEVGGNATVGAGTVTLGPNADVDGDVRYDAETLERDPGAQVGGTVTRDSSVVGGTGPAPVAAAAAFSAYGYFVNLLLGVVLLLLFPAFSRGIADRVVADTGRSLVVGLLVLVGVPILLVLLALTLVGIPLALLGAVLFVALLWIAHVYGSFAVGAWLLSLVGVENRWVALVLGLLVVGLVGLIPIVGWLISTVVLLLGLGALSLGARRRYRRPADATHGLGPAR